MDKPLRINKKQAERYHQEYLQLKQDIYLEKYGKKISFDDIDLLSEVESVILELREKYKIGNIDTRDKYDEVAAIDQKIDNILFMHNLYDGYVADT